MNTHVCFSDLNKISVAIEIQKKAINWRQPILMYGTGTVPYINYNAVNASCMLGTIDQTRNQILVEKVKLQIIPAS